MYVHMYCAMADIALFWCIQKNLLLLIGLSINKIWESRAVCKWIHRSSYLESINYSSNPIQSGKHVCFLVYTWCKIVSLYDIDFNVLSLEFIIIYEWISFSPNLLRLVCSSNDVNSLVYYGWRKEWLVYIIGGLELAVNKNRIDTMDA